MPASTPVTGIRLVATAETEAMERRILQLERKLHGFAAKSQAAGKETRSFGVAAMSAAVASGTILAQAITRSAQAMGNFVVESAQAGIEMRKLMESTGGSAPAIQAMTLAAQMSGASLQDMSQVIRKMQDTIGKALIQPSGEAATALRAIGLSAERLNLMPVEAQFIAISSALKDMDDQGARVARGNAILGEGAAKLSIMMSDSYGSISSAISTLNASGTAVTNEDLNNIQKASEAFNAVSGSIQQLGVWIAAKLAPAFTTIIDKFRESYIETGVFKDTLLALAPVAVIVAKFIADGFTAAALTITSISYAANSTLGFITRVGQHFGYMTEESIAWADALWKSYFGSQEESQRANEERHRVEQEKRDAALGKVKGGVNDVAASFETAAARSKAAFDKIFSGVTSGADLGTVVMTALKTALDAVSESAEKGNHIFAQQASVMMKIQMAAASIAQTPPAPIYRKVKLDMTDVEADLAKQDAMMIEMMAGHRGTMASAWEGIGQDSIDYRLSAEEEYQKKFAEYQQSQMDSEKQMQDATRMQWESGMTGKLEILGGVMDAGASLMQSKSKKMFEVGKMMAMSSTIIETILGAQKAFTSLAGIPVVGPALGAAAAAAAIASGVVRLQQIKAQKFGSSSAPSNVSGKTPSISDAGGAQVEGAAGASAATPAQIVVTGGPIISVDQLRDVLRDARERNVRLDGITYAS
jgi:hypothetical protein